MENNYVYEPEADSKGKIPVIVHKDVHTLANNFYSAHYHDSIEILDIISGDGTICINGKKLPVQKGDIVIINSKHIHDFETTSQLTYYCFIINNMFMKQLNIPYTEYFIQPKINDKKIHTYLANIVKEKDSADLWADEVIKANTTLILVNLFRKYKDTQTSNNSYNISKKTKMVTDALDYIRDNYMKNITIEDVSSATGYSKFYLCRNFKEVTNHTIIKYINYLKCTNAKVDLQSDDYSIGEVAQKYGFENTSYFSEIFKTYFGKSPSFFKTNESENDLP